MINLDKKYSMCDFCGVMVPTRDIYVDYIIDDYSGLCMDHFYSKYTVNVQGYYYLVKNFDDSVITESEFEVKRKCETGIHYEFNFPENIYGDFNEENKEKFRIITYNDIVTCKTEKKFEFIEILSADDYVNGVYTLRYDLRVYFKSYLEYLENQLFLSMRNHFLEEYRKSLEQEKYNPAVLC